MAQRRMINKADYESPQWPRLTLLDRYLYLGIMLYADDDGIMMKSHLLGRVLYPTDAITEEALDEALWHLASHHLIHSYEGDGDCFIQVLRWWMKQNIDSRMYRPTTFPTSDFHLAKPPDLKSKDNRPDRFYSREGRPIPVQNNLVEVSGRSGQSISEISRRDEQRSEDDDLPFESDGHTNPRYSR